MANYGMQTGGGQARVTGVAGVGGCSPCAAGMGALPGLDNVTSFIGQYGAYLIGGMFLLYAVGRLKK